MPDNNFFNSNDLPKRNDNQNNQPNQPNQPSSSPQEVSANEEHKNIIEIPQSYYDKLAQEEQVRQAEARMKAIKQQEANEAKASFDKFLSIALLNALLIFASTYAFLNINELFIFAIPAFIVILSLVFAFKQRKESNYPVTLLIGGIIVAVITFIVSMIQEEQMDLWTHYSIVAVVVGFIGAFTSSIITKIITSHKEIKALQFTGYILYFIILIGLPFFLENKFHEEFHRYVFLDQVAVEAETEEEFITKTLNVRYGETFTCSDKIKYQVDESNRSQTSRTCTSSQGTQITVISKVYNELDNQYVVIDDYLDKLYLSQSKEQLTSRLATSVSAEKVELFLYPETNCTFYGDCADCEEYYERYNVETSIDNQYEQSVKINFSKNLNKDSKSFINEHNFKYIINIISTYDETSADYQSIIDNTLEQLNNLGYKNTFGYVINIYNVSSSSFGNTNKLVYKVKGSTNDDQTFKDSEVVDISGYHSN